MILPDTLIEEFIHNTEYTHRDFDFLFERFPLSDFSFQTVNGRKTISFTLMHNNNLSIGFLCYSSDEPAFFILDGNTYTPALFVKYLVSLYDVDDIYCEHHFLRDIGDMRERNFLSCFIRLFFYEAFQQSLFSFAETFDISNIQLMEHSDSFLSLSFDISHDGKSTNLNGHFSTLKKNSALFTPGSYKPINLSDTLTERFPLASQSVRDQFSPFSRKDRNSSFLKTLLHTYLLALYKESNDFKLRQLFDTRLVFES